MLLAVSVLSFLGAAAAFWLWFTLLRRARLSQLSAYTFLTPVIGLVSGRVFFDEQIHGLALVGIALSLLGIVIAHRGGSARAVESLAVRSASNE